mmetsp:Transcript_621/g.1250  ORF Transcript_621/g.1250 Transcript_621/m.1250 type:complete len:433 (+) Transcript_621:21-1319(+)
MVWPSADDRGFVQELNVLSKQFSSAAFGDPGMLSRVKAQRQVAFAKAAAGRWPELGELRFTEEREGVQRVDTGCAFWHAGQKRYSEALGRYFESLESLSRCQSEEQKSLLLDLGFLMIENFISEEEELDLLNYWDKEGPVFPLGTEENRSRRRFFHYGPILAKETMGTSKSTLNVIPSQLGAMPQVVEHMKLQPRLREAAQQLDTAAHTLAFDQMYVNYYDTSIDSYIDFHHDHQSCMLGTIAGVSLKSSCHLQLKPTRQRQALSIELPPRSLFFMSGLSRWHLQHAIPQLRSDRLSLTFRSVDRSCSREMQWARCWEALTAAEAANAHWPLVNPEGVEQHDPHKKSAKAISERSKGSGKSGKMSYSGYSYYRPKAGLSQHGYGGSHFDVGEGCWKCQGPDHFARDCPETRDARQMVKPLKHRRWREKPSNS